MSSNTFKKRNDPIFLRLWCRRPSNAIFMSMRTKLIQEKIHFEIAQYQPRMRCFNNIICNTLELIKIYIDKNIIKSDFEVKVHIHWYLIKRILHEHSRIFWKWVYFRLILGCWFGCVCCSLVKFDPEKSKTLQPQYAADCRIFPD